MKKTWLALLLLCLALPALAEFVPGEMIVQFKPGAEPTATGSVSSLNQKYQVKKIEKLSPTATPPSPSVKTLADGKVVKVPDFSRDYRFFFDESADIPAIVKDYKDSGTVVYAQPNYIYKALRTPNDTYYSSQWHLPKIQADLAWEISTGEASAIIVADIDTGVKYTHEDLTGKVITGWDFVNNDNNPMDDNGHGTHIAGIIGAMTDNATGIAGINWNAQILAIKVLDSRGYGSSVDTKSGMTYAADYPGCKVLSMSFGQYSEDYYIKSGVEYAYAKGCVLAAAAGNEDTSDPIYPGSYPEVIAVAATDQNDHRSVWNTTDASNYGTWVDVASPGTSIYSTWISGTPPYKNSNGTSMATPLVAGLASLLLSINPNLTPDQVKSILENTADNIDSLNPGYVGLLGKGRINAYAALQTYLKTSLTYPTANQYVAGSQAVQGTAGGYAFNSYQILLNGAQLYSSSTAVDNGKLYDLNTTLQPDGAYNLMLRTTGTAGLFTGEAQVSITIDNTLPTAEITSPTLNSTVEGAINITGQATDLNFDYYYLEYSKDGTNYTRFATSGTAQPGGLLGRWDSSNLSGSYFIRLTVKDKAGNARTFITNVEVILSNPSGASVTSLVKASPNPFNPSVQAETFLNYDLSSNYTITLYLFDLSGELIWQKYIQAGEEGGKQGPNLVPWNGKNLYGQGVANGVYIFKILAEVGGAKKSIASGKLIVLRN